MSKFSALFDRRNGGSAPRTPGNVCEQKKGPAGRFKAEEATP
jgi:hypothetical protein